MTAIDYAWLALGGLAVAALWYAVLRRPDRLSEDSIRLAGQRAERERGSYRERERLRMRGEA
jgi:hypothetical protein